MRSEGNGFSHGEKKVVSPQEIQGATEAQLNPDLFEKIIPICQSWTQGFQRDLLPHVEKNIPHFLPEQREKTYEWLTSILESLTRLNRNSSPAVAKENLIQAIHQEINTFIHTTLPFFEGRKEKFYAESPEMQRGLKERFVRIYNVLKSFKIFIADILRQIEAEREGSAEGIEELIEEVRKNTAFTIFVSAFGKDIRDWGDGEDRNSEDSGYICQRRNFGKFQGIRAVEESREMIGGQNRPVLGHQEDDSLSESNVVVDGKSSRLKRDIIAYGKLGEKTLGESTSLGKSDEPAFFVKMTINSDVRDRMGRTGGFPELTIVGSNEDVNKVIQFLWKHPEQYYQFISNLFTQEEAPKTREKIIGKATPTSEVVFLNAMPLRTAILQGEAGLLNKEGRLTEKALLDNRFTAVAETKK